MFQWYYKLDGSMTREYSTKEHSVKSDRTKIGWQMNIVNTILLLILLGVFSNVYAGHHEATEQSHKHEMSEQEEQADNKSEEKMRTSCAKDASQKEPKFSNEKSCLEAHGLKN